MMLVMMAVMLLSLMMMMIMDNTCVIKIILHQAVTRTVTLKVQHGYSPQLTPKEPRRELFTFILKMVNS